MDTHPPTPYNAYNGKAYPPLERYIIVERPLTLEIFFDIARVELV